MAAVYLIIFLFVYEWFVILFYLVLFDEDLVLMWYYFYSYLTFDQECSWVWMKNQVDFTRKLGLKTNTLEVKVLIKIIFKLVKTLIVTGT